MLEDAGYTVNVTEFSEWGIAYAALTKGDVQILASQTDYVAQDYWNKNKSRLEKISPVSHGLFQGIAVPTYVTVNSIDELNANADKFGGKIIGIEPGAGLMRDTDDAVDEYDLDLELVEGSTAGMTAALKSAVDRQEWIVVTLWEPSWMVQKFDVKFLQDPKGVFPPPQSYYWIGQEGFSEENPEARELIASVFVPDRRHHRDQRRGEATARRWTRRSPTGSRPTPTCSSAGKTSRATDARIGGPPATPARPARRQTHLEG